MKETTNDSLARAIIYLGAVEVAPDYVATPPPTAFNAIMGWRVFRKDSIVLEGEGAPYTRAAHSMPSWWSPEQRFAWRKTTATGTFTYSHSTHADGYHRITADLATGEEIPA